MSRVLFLDRDGVINADYGHVWRSEDFVFLPHVFEALHRFQEAGYLLIVVTNQAGIAKGYYTEEDFAALTRWMLCEFRKRGVEITDVFYCPYHRDGIGRYRRHSPDRKPEPGMILKARDKYSIDLAASVLVGDKLSDIEAGRRAGVGRLVLLGEEAGPLPAGARRIAGLRELEVP